MYLPESFAEARLPELHGMIDSAGLATLVTAGPAGPEASHLPLLLAAEEGPFGTLYGHLARANPQWRLPGPALAIFTGPDGYVSPSWYPSKAADGRVVPTWNYIAVHAAGKLEVFEDAARLRDLVERLTRRHESGRPVPWQVADAPADYIASMLRGIVGVRLPIERLEGKWKLSQNRTDPDRAGVIDGLKAEKAAAPAALADAMELAARAR